MEGFLSSVRTAHFILLAASASILLFALSPRDAEEYESAQLEAEFLNEAFHDNRASLIFRRDAYKLVDTAPVTQYVGSLFSSKGIVVASNFRYEGPRSTVVTPSPPTLQDIARISQNYYPAVMYVFSKSEVPEILDNLRSNEAKCFKSDGNKFAIFETGVIEPCAPLDPRGVLRTIRVASYDDTTKSLNEKEVPIRDIHDIPPFPSGWYAFLEFGKDKETTVYAHEVAFAEFREIGDVASSPYDMFRVATRESPLLAQARGDTTLLGRLVIPFREAWCKIQLATRNTQIENAKEQLEGTEKIPSSRIAAITTYRQRMKIVLSDYGQCHPGRNILGLPHLDGTWWEMAEKTPKQALTLYQQKAIASRQRISVSGLQIDERSVRLFLPFGCMAVSLFLLSNLVILRQHVSEGKCRNSIADALDYPWLGLYSDPLSRTLTWLSVVALPVLVPPVVLFQLSEQFDFVCTLGVIFTLGTLVIAHRSMKIIRHLRLARVRPNSTS